MTKYSNMDVVSIFLAEVLGTGLLLFLGCMGCVIAPDFIPTHVSICLNFGLAVMLIIQIFGCVSGAHLNPSVTLAAVVYEHITIPIAFVYILAQIIGAFIGYGLLNIVTPTERFLDSELFCMTVPAHDISIVQAFSVEFIITSILILVCCGVWDPRNVKNTDSVAIRFGLTVACLSLSAGPYTGASMNPARSLGPALWNMKFDYHWIYWTAPPTASLLTSIAYKTIFKKE